MNLVLRKYIFGLAAWVCFAAGHAIAGEGGEFHFEGEPVWVADSKGFSASVRVEGLEAVAGMTVAYAYPGGAGGVVTAQAAARDATWYQFTVPAAPGSGPGEVKYTAEALYGSQGKERKSSETRRLPLGRVEELDITGEAAQALLYRLGGPEYTVRYVPCCNIYGGVTIAERVPVNPAASAAGLPERVLSDFVVLKPDSLSASTMGLYFDFALGAERVKDVTPVLYEFDGARWREFNGYESDAALGRISMHCPEGGTFVVGAAASAKGQRNLTTDEK